MKNKQNVFYVFSKKDFYTIAKIIDNNFNGKEDSFTCERKKGYYYLNTNKCDDCSIIRIFCKIGNINIEKIERIGSDTVSYQEIHKETYLKIEKYIQSLVC